MEGGEALSEQENLLSTIPRLPVACRVFDGENCRSLSGRLLAANGVSRAVLEDYLAYRYGVELSSAAVDHLEVWRHLGGLDRRAFSTAPVTPGGEWVTDRRLCLRCCAGQDASGRAPTVGRICLRHRLWLPNPRVKVASPVHLAAERDFRRRLSSHGVTFDGPWMRAGLELAAILNPLGSPATAEALYPVQVRAAAWLHGVVATWTGSLSLERVVHEFPEELHVGADLFMQQRAASHVVSFAHASSRVK